MRSFASLILVASFATATSAALIEVVPGPGTPLQDAIDAAAPRDKILVRAGAYLETIVIDKPLNIVAEGQVEVGPEIEPLESSCAPAFVLEIATTELVSIKATGSATTARRNAGITFHGGGTASVKVEPQSNVKFSKVGGHSFCPGAGGLVNDDASFAKIKGGAYTGYALSGQGGPGCRITQPSGGHVMLKGVRCAGSISGGSDPNRRAGPGLLLDGVAAVTPRQVKIFHGTVVSCGSAAAVLESADGAWIKGGYYEACPFILGQPPYYAVTLDGQSDGNVVEGATLAGPVLDAGTGNCFRRNEAEDGTALPDDCP